MQRQQLLLHTCCAPCVTVPLERLKADYEISCFFYNPNIHPAEEYSKRLEEIQNLVKQLDVEIIIHHYDSDRWFELANVWEDEPEGGERCKICFRMRLQETAKYAKAQGFKVFTTTLSISPHKDAELINQIGEELGEQNQIKFLAANFKKKNGYKQSIELSRKYDLYRQNYCGCIFSRNDRK
jgi:predicted adenine nucleotide alpha hydrolase (AANH) superfamily ATPase